MAINTTTSMPANLYLYYSKVLLDRLTRNLVLDKLGQKSLNIPKGFGTQAKWLRYNERHVANPATFILSQGTAPTPVAIGTLNVTATVQQYGNFAIITDLLNYTAIDPVLEDVMGVLSDEAAELVDTIIKLELEANLPTQFANNKPNLANTGVNDVMTAKEILKAVVFLKKNSVKPHELGYYVSVVHPASGGDIQNDTNIGSFIDVYKYTDNKAIIDTEKYKLGKVYGTEIWESENLSSTTVGTLAGATVYTNFLLGRGAFGTVRLGGENISTFIKGADTGGTSDPLEQVSTAGYKLLGFVAKYLGGSGNGTADRGRQIRAGSGY